MRRALYVLAVTLLGLAGSGLRAQAPDPAKATVAPELDRARAAATALSTELRARLMQEMGAGGPCLACHGDPAAMKPEVAAMLRELFPEDRAVGYKDGDFRGAVSVSVAAPVR
jgi:hypothetical protein